MQAFVFSLLLVGLGPSAVHLMGKGRKGKPSLGSRASQPLEEWRELPYDELVVACSEAGLPTSGTADVLANRVHSYYHDVAENELMRGSAVVSSRGAPYQVSTSSSNPATQAAITATMAASTATSTFQSYASRSNAALDSEVAPWMRTPLAHTGWGHTLGGGGQHLGGAPPHPGMPPGVPNTDPYYVGYGHITAPVTSSLSGTTQPTPPTNTSWLLHQHHQHQLQTSHPAPLHSTHHPQAPTHSAPTGHPQLSAILQSLNTLTSSIVALSGGNALGHGGSPAPHGPTAGPSGSSGAGSGAGFGGVPGGGLHAHAPFQQAAQPPTQTQPLGPSAPPLQVPAFPPGQNNSSFHHSQVHLGAFPGVPNKFILQIQKGEYVNFDALFSSLLGVPSHSQGYSLVLAEADSDSPSISVLKDPAKERKIRGFPNWIRAWNTFFSVAIHFRPHLVTQLLAYQSAISQLASTYHLAYWLAYDVAFRQKMANNPLMRWDVEDSTLFVSYLRAAPVLASAALPVAAPSPAQAPAAHRTYQAKSSDAKCFGCGRTGHFQKQCPSAPTPAAHPGPAPSPPPNTPSGTPPFRDSRLQPAGSGVCFSWNNGRPCPAGCNREHRCSFCGKLHSRSECPHFN